MLIASYATDSSRHSKAYQDNSVAWMFGGKDVVLDGEGTGTLFGNGQVRLVESSLTSCID